MSQQQHSLNRRELFAFKKESSALKFQTYGEIAVHVAVRSCTAAVTYIHVRGACRQGWRKKSVSESIFKKWTKDEHIKFVAVPPSS
jgi:hypothetical protein